VPRLLVVIGSTRPGRVGLPVGQWLVGRARASGDWEVDVADLAEIALPFLDEPEHPRLRRYTKPHTLAWSARVDAADAVVFVIPEYNHGINAATKNAIDFLNQEWALKPVGTVSYGGVSAGTRAAEMLNQVVTTLRMVTVQPAVNIPFVAQFIGDDGAVVPNAVMEAAADAMLAELLRMTPVLATLRRVETP
jgi:NAD(P)H-dependent FMN reductase